MSADYTTSLIVDQSPEQAFSAITNVRGWWSEMVEGSTEKPGDEFIYRHKDLHYSKQKLIEVIPNKKVVWLVTDSDLSFVKTKDAWTGTQISFEIERKKDKTEIVITHHGLVPEVECFKDCSNGWNYYLKGSLMPLITKGVGSPDRAEHAEK